MLGDNILVAPVIEKGKSERTIIFPKGNWVSELGESYSEGKYIINAPLNRIPIFNKI